MILFVMSATAGTTLFDFESDDDLAAWQLRSAGQDTLERAHKFATSGSSSALFRSPTWREGMEQWPAFEAKPPVTDWTEYDRLVIDVTNPEADRPFLSIHVTDGTTPFRQGLSYLFDLPRRGFHRAVVPLSSFPPHIDRTDIALLHIFSQRPAADMRLYVDNVTLLRAGETMPDPPEVFVNDVARLLDDTIDDTRALLEICRRRAEEIGDAAPVRRYARRQLRTMNERIDTLADRLAARTLAVAEVDAVRAELDRVPRRCDRLVSILEFQKGCLESGVGENGVLVGTASSMKKLLPRDMPFSVRASSRAELSLARNEKESLQVVVLPLEQDLRGVTVTVADLRSDEGAVFAADRIDCDVVGYVETKKRPPYPVSYVGWWPDPVLDFLGPIDIVAGDLQAFWIRVRAPKDQAPGLYQGTLHVAAEGLKPIALELAVRVYGFTLPDHTPLPTAVTFGERRKQMGGADRWDEMRFAYADFLADYHIDYDSLYRRDPPDFDVLRRLHDQGRLVAFNLGNVFNAGAPAEGFEKAVAEVVERIRPAYDEAKAFGLLDYAYIYGFDERGAEHFDSLEKSAQALRAAFPDVLLMTTSYDQSYGLDSIVKTIDAWCPLTAQFDSGRAAQAREVGKRVWWYICCGPHNPYANWFVEYDAIEARLLMGAMTAKYRPDGFLYYALTIWNDNEPIESGPFTEWDPVSWTVYHGDGSLICSGAGGKPVPTIRLENYRDGMEDFAYACILEEIVRQYAAREDALAPREREWLDEARGASAVPDSLIRDLADFSRDPDDLYAYRNRLADLIERSGVADANPWGNRFTVRGFWGRK